MRNLHNILLQEDGIEARRLFRLWEKLKIRASDYRNHRIFTLRCLHSDLIPVSIKLKSTIKSTRAKQILRKAEKELLQARIKSINFILDSTSQQLEECRSKLATIISTQKLRECQDFIDKVSEDRFNKVKQRQINKLNLLTTRKEGNITRSNTNLNNYSHNHNHNYNSQGNSQVISQAPPGEDNRSSQAGPPMERLAPLQPPYPAARLGKTALFPRLALPLPLPGKMPVFPRSVPPFPPTLPLLGKMPVFPRSVPPLPPFPPSLPLPGKTPVFLRSVHPLPPFLPSLLLSCLHRKTGDLLTSLTPKQVNLTIQQTILGKVAGNPQGKGPPRPPRRVILPPGKAITPLPPPLGIPRVLLKKNLTLSGSLTFPTNPWHQLKGLFWLKGPTLRLPPGSLPT